MRSAFCTLILLLLGCASTPPTKSITSLQVTSDAQVRSTDHLLIVFKKREARFFALYRETKFFLAASGVNIFAIPHSHLCGLYTLGVLCVILFFCLPHVAMSLHRQLASYKTPIVPRFFALYREMKLSLNLPFLGGLCASPSVFSV